jgi:hypothetical protein
MITPPKQPVVADKTFVDVDYIQPGTSPGHLTCWSCAVKRLPGTFQSTVRSIMREGIWSADESWFIPPGAIVKIRDRREVA